MGAEPVCTEHGCTEACLQSLGAQTLGSHFGGAQSMGVELSVQRVWGCTDSVHSLVPRAWAKTLGAVWGGGTWVWLQRGLAAERPGCREAWLQRAWA